MRKFLARVSVVALALFVGATNVLAQATPNSITIPQVIDEDSVSSQLLSLGGAAMAVMMGIGLGFVIGRRIFRWAKGAI